MSRARALLRAAVFVAAAATVVALACAREAEEEDRTSKPVTDAAERAVALSWDAAANSTVTAYHVYAVKGAVGSTDAAAAAVTAAAVVPEAWRLVEELTVPSAGFDAAAPRTVMRSTVQVILKEFIGGMACFRIAAYAPAGESPASNIVCGVVE